MDVIWVVIVGSTAVGGLLAWWGGGRLRGATAAGSARALFWLLSPSAADS